MQYEEMVERMRAFQESRILLTAIELNLFTAVGDRATAAEVASRLSTDPRGTEMLLNALVALEMLTKRDGVFRNTPVAARRLVDGSPENERDAFLHTVNLWDRWSTLTDCVRAGTAVSLREIPDRSEQWIEAFIAAMHRNAVGRAPRVVKAAGTEGIRRMLDVGGGSGAYSIAFARARPGLQAEILDLPVVLPIAQRHIGEAGLSERVKTRAGDLRSGKFGENYDLIFISAICHMLGPDENRDLFRRSFAALAAGGRIVVQDFLLEADKTAPRAAALFAINMLVGTRNGSSYGEEEYAAWLQEAGFQHVRRIPLDGPTGLMAGVRG